METLLKTKTAAPGETDFRRHGQISLVNNFQSEIIPREKIAPANADRLTPAEEPYEYVVNERLTYIHEQTISALEEEDDDDDDDDLEDELDEVDLDEDDTEELDDANLDDDDLDMELDEDDEEDEDVI